MPDTPGPGSRSGVRGLLSVRGAIVGLLCTVALVGVAVQFGYVDGLPDSEVVTDGELSPSLQLNETETEQLIYEGINDERTERGLDPLERDRTMQWVARNHSQDMRDRGFFAHENPDGLTPADRISRAGVDCVDASENIIKLPRQNHEQRLADDAIQAWLDSPGHLINLLNSDWERTGVGVVADGQTVYITQTFCE